MDINITPEIKKYLVERIGETETEKLILAVREDRPIVLTGPACTGKTTIHAILFSLGYPWSLVMENNYNVSAIKCNNKLSDNPEDRKPLPEILYDLGIYKEWIEMNLSC